jgi:hypothetical protein
VLMQQGTSVPGRNCSSTLILSACCISAIFAPRFHSYTVSGRHTLKKYD